MTQQYQYKWQSITEEISVNADAYTAALASAMERTKEMLSAQILKDCWGTYVPDNHEIEVNFDGKE